MTMDVAEAVAELTQREATEQLVRRCLEDDNVLWLCMDRLAPPFFAFDYDLRIIFYATAGWFLRGSYDPETNLEYMAYLMALLEGRERANELPAAIHNIDEPGRRQATAAEWYRRNAPVWRYPEADVLDAIAEGWLHTFESDWYTPAFTNPSYGPALLDALEDQLALELDLVNARREYFTRSPLRPSEAAEDAAWDRIGEAMNRRRAIHLAKIAPALPRLVALPKPTDWDGVIRRIAAR